MKTGDAETLHLAGHNLRAYIEGLEKRMRQAAADLEFEEAAHLRDELRRLESAELGLGGTTDIDPKNSGGLNEAQRKYQPQKPTRRAGTAGSGKTGRRAKAGPGGRSGV